MIIGGITYEVVAVAQFLHNGARREEITLRRPNGKRAYHAVRYEDGSLSEAV